MVALTVPSARRTAVDDVGAGRGLNDLHSPCMFINPSLPSRSLSDLVSGCPSVRRCRCLWTGADTFLVLSANVVPPDGRTPPWHCPPPVHNVRSPGRTDTQTLSIIVIHIKCLIIKYLFVHLYTTKQPSKYHVTQPSTFICIYKYSKGGVLYKTVVLYLYQPINLAN